MSKITSFPRSAEQPSTEGMPPASSIVSGSPSFKTWLHFEDGNMRSGEWEVMPGSWKVSYDRWEFMHILSGTGTLHSETGEVIKLEPGVSVVTQPGFKGHWVITEPLRKAFFVRGK
jgi:uncharacterized protein